VRPSNASMLPSFSGTFAGAPILSSEGTPNGGVVSARAMTGAIVNTQSCARVEVEFTAMIQTFHGPVSSPKQMTSTLRHAWPTVQILVVDDSHEQSAAWMGNLTGPWDHYIAAPDLSEIRAFNAMAKLARGEYIVILQGDFCLLSETRQWLAQSAQLFQIFPRLVIIGGHYGWMRVTRPRTAQMGIARRGVGPGIGRRLPQQLRLPANCSPTWTTSAAEIAPWVLRSRTSQTVDVAAMEAAAHLSDRVPATGDLPFSFVAAVNIGPIVARRAAWQDLGGFDEGFGQKGGYSIDCDTDLSLRAWKRGYAVGLIYMAHYNGHGGRLSLRTARTSKYRMRLERTNSARVARSWQDNATELSASIARYNSQLEPISQSVAAISQPEVLMPEDGVCSEWSRPAPRTKPVTRSARRGRGRGPRSAHKHSI